MLSTCKHQESKSGNRGFALKSRELGKAKTFPFEKHWILAFDNRWLQVNDKKPLVFEVKLTKNGKLELSASLSALDSSKEVDTNAR